MVTLIAIFLLSLVVSLVLTPHVHSLATRFNLVDRPDGRRKIHARPTPLGGGIAVLASSCLSLATAFLAAEWVRPSLDGEGRGLLGLLLAVFIICIVGVLDDYGLLRGRHKLLGQLVATCIVVSFGVVVPPIQVFQWSIDLGLFAYPFTVFLLLGAINSLNLLDGMDGLLSCVGIIILSAMSLMAILGEHTTPALVAMALAGSLLGFLRYNYPPASIFLGDCGSMLIGLVIGVLAIQCSLKKTATAALAAPLATLTIPILDTTAAIVRRKLTGRSLYTTDRGHLHHFLLSRGLSARWVLLCVSSLCLLTVVGALASLALKNELVAILSAAAVVGILIGVRIFGYTEFLLAWQRLVGAAGSWLQLRPKNQPQETEVHLQGSLYWKETWDRFTLCARELNLQSLRLDVNAPFIHEGYHALWYCPEKEAEMSSLWFAELPLMAFGQVVGRVEIAGRRDDRPIWDKIAILTKLAEHVETVVFSRAEQMGNGTVLRPAFAPAVIEADSAHAG